MSIVFLFIDGVGLGKKGEQNPLDQDRWKGFNFMGGGEPVTDKTPAIQQQKYFFKGVDACLGVEGLPQSGTGQTALFTGKNAPAKIGKHFGPYPHSGVKPFLEHQSVFKKAQEKGKNCTFINAYPNIFFKKSEKRNRWSCTTLMTKKAGLALHTTEDVKKEEALTAGLTQQAWREKLTIDVPVITPQQAAQRLLKVSLHYDLLLHEYYLTDKAGHRKNKKEAEAYIDQYDRFLWTLIRQKPEDTTIVLCSDHGNIEDLSTKTHTLNNVPLFVYGPGADVFWEATSIMDVTPGIMDLL